MAYCIANARGIRRRRGLEKMAGQYYGQTLATVTLTLTCSATYKINKNEDTKFRSHLRNRQLGTAFRATYCNNIHVLYFYNSDKRRRPYGLAP